MECAYTYIVTMLKTKQLIIESIFAILLFIWVILVTFFLTKRLYSFIISKNQPHKVAVYYCRKVIHMLCGGLVAVLTPYFFKTPLIPLIFAFIVALLLYIPHRKRKLFYWFQVEENMFEVHFAIMWGFSIFFGWALFECNYWFGIIPVAYMSFGDAVTGFIRNLIFKKRTKSWWGNLAMLITTFFIGSKLGLAGIISAFIASFAEHFEWKFIDDNIIVPAVTILTLAIFYVYLPSLFTVMILW